MRRADRCREEPCTTPDGLELAHRHGIYHRAGIRESAWCGCFQCIRRFPPERITDWADSGQTALCPFCSVDAVLGSASGYPLTKAFLLEMHARWFE
jgi:hypothetical protein